MLAMTFTLDRRGVLAGTAGLAAATLLSAGALPEADRRARMHRMKQAVEANTAARWAHLFLAELERPRARAA